MFTRIQLQRPNFDVAMVYHKARKLMQGKVQLPVNVAMKEAKDCIEAENTECIKEQAASKATEALCRWKGWKKDPPSATELDGGLHLDDNSLHQGDDMKVATSYLANIRGRATRERLQMKPGVVKLAYSGHKFSVVRRNGSRVYAQKVLLDTEAQPIMLGKNLTVSLGIKAEDLDPCPFTIATSLGAENTQEGLQKNL